VESLQEDCLSRGLTVVHQEDPLPWRSVLHVCGRELIFTITSVANHQNVLPIFSLTVVLLCILLNPCRHRPSPIVPFYPLKSTRSSLLEKHRQSYYLRRQPPECSSHILADCSLDLYPRESMPPSSIVHRQLFLSTTWLSQIHSIFPHTLSFVALKSIASEFSPLPPSPNTRTLSPVIFWHPTDLYRVSGAQTNVDLIRFNGVEGTTWWGPGAPPALRHHFNPCAWTSGTSTGSQES
jgi:hypothetical protein